MPILALGVSFRRTPIELLERLAFTDDDLIKAYRVAKDLDGVEGAVVLSTCNRVEVYGDVGSYHAGFLALKRLLTETREVGAEELAEPLYSHWERDAADHLFAVASGLDSMVLGETQIQSQVREAVRRAGAERAGTPALTGLFHAAARAGRRVRQETSIGAAPDAFVSMGADLADEAVGGLAGRDVVIVGAGAMAALAVKHLRSRGVATVRILNRSLEHARSLALRSDAEHGGLDALPAAMREADLVVSATGAAGTVIDRDAVAHALSMRDGRPLVLLDLAVPRDVDPGTDELDGARVIDIVSLRQRLTELADDAADDITKAQRIVADEVRRFLVRRRGDELAPLIRAVRRRGDEVAHREIERFSSRLSGLTRDEREAVEALARGITAKLLHDPIIAIKERSASGGEPEHARVLAELLGIDEPPADGGGSGSPPPS
ncbi:MAG TPA: glutamyl-tRNA reductase [Actinomycetota bacterium]|nr:glutamyl-tRNA reductase [Actinomycetota bacterium]